MTELEILEHAYITIDRIWNLAQWYVAISLAVVTAAHLAATRLNLFILIVMICLYSTYTLLIGSAFVWNYQVMAGYFEALTQLDSQNNLIMQPVYDGLAHPSGYFAPILYPSIGVVVYVASVAFLIRTYFQETRKRN